MKKAFIPVLALASCLIPVLSYADPVGGAIRDRDVVRGDGGQYTYTFVARARETTAVVVDGDGDGDIDCVLRDDNGNVVASDFRDYDGCRMSVNPRWTGQFTLLLVNHGDMASAYSLRIY